MSLASLLEARSESDPSGSDLEYDSEFSLLERAARPTPDKQVGDEIIPGEDPDYAQVKKSALSVLERSHDLRAAVWLAQAELRIGGFEAFAEALEFIHDMMTRWWDSCHPQLDAEDDNDPTARANALRGLTDPETTLRWVLLAPLSQSVTFGRVSLRDVLIASGEIQPGEGAEALHDAAAIAAALRDTDSSVLVRRHAALQQARQHLNGIDKFFDEKAIGFGPDVTELDKLLRRALSRLSEVLGDSAGAAGEVIAGTETGEAAPDGAQSSQPRQQAQGTISSPADVRMALDRIIAYYRDHEPSSPMPLLLNRARRLVGCDFITIMRDLSPSSVGGLRELGGLPEDEE